jgi:hypothetical protein
LARRRSRTWGFPASERFHSIPSSHGTAIGESLSRNCPKQRSAAPWTVSRKNFWTVLNRQRQPPLTLRMSYGQTSQPKLAVRVSYGRAWSLPDEVPLRPLR